MHSLSLKLVYDGLDASEHRMPLPYPTKISKGAHLFLGVNAYLLTQGHLPKQIRSQSKFFSIDNVQHGPGCWCSEHNLVFTAAAGFLFGNFLVPLGKGLLNDAADATRESIKAFAKQTFSAWRDKRILADNLFERKEPVFTETGGNHAPIVPVDEEREVEYRRLLSYIDIAVRSITSPLGKAADRMEMWIGDECVHKEYSRTPSVADVTAALVPVRANLHRRQF